MLAAELLSRTTGLGAQLRFYSLFEQFDHVFLYALMVLVVCLGLLLLERGLVALIKRTPLWRST